MTHPSRPGLLGTSQEEEEGAEEKTTFWTLASLMDAARGKEAS